MKKRNSISEKSSGLKKDAYLDYVGIFFRSKLTDEQFATMIKRADTTWAEEFLKKHPQPKIQRFSMVIRMGSPYGLLTLLGESLPVDQRQVIEQRTGADLFAL
jgi:hypothetical protein